MILRSNVVLPVPALPVKKIDLSVWFINFNMASVLSMSDYNMFSTTKIYKFV
jgi:hypothetical protein